MREIRTSGSEGGGTTCSPYPYCAAAKPCVTLLAILIRFHSSLFTAFQLFTIHDLRFSISPSSSPNGSHPVPDNLHASSELVIFTLLGLKVCKAHSYG
jgi:hypothetical protein